MSSEHPEYFFMMSWEVAAISSYTSGLSSVLAESWRWHWSMAAVSYMHLNTTVTETYNTVTLRRKHWQKKLCTYNKFIYELSESREATLVRQRVWVVSILVHDTAGLQGPGTVKEGGGQLLQAILCSKMQQRGKLLGTLIWRTKSRQTVICTAVLLLLWVSSSKTQKTSHNITEPGV